jgi:CO/xanthine dehydrogenase Mo-binding subunit
VVVTNTTQIAAFRGAGRPEAIQAIEAAIDRFAAELGMDPPEVRRKNYVSEFPHTTATGAAYDSGDYAGALDLALRSAGYDELRAEQKRRRDEGTTTQLGIGLSSYVEITNPLGEGELARSRSRRTGPRSSGRAPSRTARATRPASRWSSPSGSGCRSRR